MKAWWDARAPRERLLLQVAALVCLLAVVVQGVLGPIQKMRAEAELAVAESESTLVRLSRLKDAGILVPAAGPAPETADPGPLAARWAGEMGLLPAGAPGSDNSLSYRFAPADPKTVFAWIDRAEAELDLMVTYAELVSSDGGQVAAAVTFSGKPAP